MNSSKEEDSAACCAHGDTGVAAGSALAQFQQFLAATLQPGAIDVVSKELIAVALGLAVHCVPCSQTHIKKAFSMGISKAQLKEAAALAIAFSGCRALMLWNDLEQELLK